MKSFFLLVLISFKLFAGNNCVYQSLKNENLLTVFKNCIKIDKNQKILFNKKYLKDVNFGKNKIACIYSKKRVFYLKKDAYIVESFLFDNGCDYFSQGYTRIKKDNRIFYADKNLKIKIKTNYSYGSRFYKNKAIVCNNLKKRFDKNLEHYIYFTGECNILQINGKFLLKKELQYNKTLKLLELGKI